MCEECRMGGIVCSHDWKWRHAAYGSIAYISSRASVGRPVEVSLSHVYYIYIFIYVCVFTHCALRDEEKIKKERILPFLARFLLLLSFPSRLAANERKIDRRSGFLRLYIDAREPPQLSASARACIIIMYTIYTHIHIQLSQAFVLIGAGMMNKRFSQWFGARGYLEWISYEFSTFLLFARSILLLSLSCRDCVYIYLITIHRCAYKRICIYINNSWLYNPFPNLPDFLFASTANTSRLPYI